VNNYLTSLVRTWVPILIGTALSWLAVTHGIVVDPDIQNQAVAVVTALVIGAYYAIVRWIEVRFPQIGWLLGTAKQPGYSADTPPAPSPGPLPDSGSV
jgi:hypothetical protein